MDVRGGNETDGARRWVPRAELDGLCGERLGDAVLDGLWAAGDLEGLRAPCVAIVGTRAPSDDGRRRARRLAEELGRAGVCVVSGLALGIDGAAHEGALAAGGPTIGVLGGGHDRFFPPRHRELAARIAAGRGAVVSPFAPHEDPRPWQFLARNGVIAALADAVVVVEAAARSGALNTASHAADRAVPVLAFPGDVDRPKAAGCNLLIRDGATLVRDAEDVLAALPAHVYVAAPASRGEHAAARPRPDDAPQTRAVLAALADGPRDPAALADLLALPPPSLFAVLSELEIAGRLTSGPDGYALRRDR